MAKATIVLLLLIVFLLAIRKIISLLSSAEKNVPEQTQNENLPMKSQRCEKCAVGKAIYEIDEHSEVCPYLGGIKGEECGFFKPLEKQSECTEI